MKRIVFTEAELSVMNLAMSNHAPDCDEDDSNAFESARQKILLLRARLRTRKKK